MKAILIIGQEEEAFIANAISEAKKHPVSQDIVIQVDHEFSVAKE